MSDDPRLAGTVAFSLLSSLDEVEILHELYFLMKSAKFFTDHVRAVAASGELLAAPCGKASSPEFVAPETLASTPLGS